MIGNYDLIIIDSIGKSGSFYMSTFMSLNEKVNVYIPENMKIFDGINSRHDLLSTIGNIWELYYFLNNRKKIAEMGELESFAKNKQHNLECIPCFNHNFANRFYGEIAKAKLQILIVYCIRPLFDQYLSHIRRTQGSANTKLFFEWQKSSFDGIDEVEKKYKNMKIVVQNVFDEDWNIVKNRCKKLMLNVIGIPVSKMQEIYIEKRIRFGSSALAPEINAISFDKMSNMSEYIELEKRQKQLIERYLI